VLSAVNASGTVLQDIPVTQGVPLDVPLSSDGTWTFTSTWTPVLGSPVTRTLTVTVCGGALPAEIPACQLGRPRNWACPGLTPGVTLITAPGLSAAFQGGTNVLLNVSATYADHYVALRAGADGPVLDSRRVAAFWMQTALDAVAQVVEIRPTSQVWEHRMVTFGVPADVDITIRVIVAGVTFDDLAIVRTISGASLNQAGEYRFRMIHANTSSASTCHSIKASQDGVNLGDVYYAGVSVPLDIRQPVQ
jgi:hypothetical protein